MYIYICICTRYRLKASVSYFYILTRISTSIDAESAKVGREFLTNSQYELKRQGSVRIWPFNYFCQITKFDIFMI